MSVFAWQGDGAKVAFWIILGIDLFVLGAFYSLVFFFRQKGDRDDGSEPLDPV